jgi:hypothetical protein
MIGYRHLMRAFVDVEGREPVYGSYVRDLHATMRGDSLWNETTVMERMGFSALRVLDSLEYREPIALLLSTILGSRTPMLHPLDGFSDQYWSNRLDSHYSHEQAFAELENVEDEVIREWVPFTRAGRRCFSNAARRRF